MAEPVRPTVAAGAQGDLPLSAALADPAGAPVVLPVSPLPRLAIVVPVLDEVSSLAPRLQALQALRQRGARVWVVDGGSSDATAAVASAWADQVLLAPRGRAAQMNAGAWAARRWDAEVLLFLHADTGLPPGADRLIAAALAGGADWGRFDVRIQGRHPLLLVVAALMNLRSRLSGIATGDQAMFVRRRVFERVGGFPSLALMEDIGLSQRLGRVGPPACLRARVETAGRRWEQHGFWRTVLLMWRLRAAHAGGADAHALALAYGYRPRPPAALALMAKAPVPGLAKTRLAPLLGPVGAARAQRSFCLQILNKLHQASTGPVTAWCAPDAHHRFFRALARQRGLVCRDQPEGDLGQRMGAAMAQHFAQHPVMPWLVVGTDCPALTPAHLQQAADALVAHDAVLIGAEDGGYVLLGLRRPLAVVFEGIDWSTDRVLAQTRDRLRSAGARWQELPPLWDVDLPQDWQRLLASGWQSRVD